MSLPSPSPVAGAASVSDVELDRRAWRRKRQLRSVAISMLSTVVLALVVVVGLQMSPGWPHVKETFFSAEYFAKSGRP